MENYCRKPVPIVLAGALAAGLTIVEGRESCHIEQRQYQEPSKLTYENAYSTATFTIGTGYSPLVDDAWGGRAWSQFT